MAHGTQSTNRLIHATSPYLLQHAHNPVDWYPWGEEALARARAEDKPIFLSIGYSACHWCHVMERESFENESVAKVLNDHYVAIKVDREERPDLDDLYMDAVQTLTGRGGWPMSVWLTPDLRPFYGGTYFPPTSRGGMPGFTELNLRIAELWRERRDEVLDQAKQLTEELERQVKVEPGQALPDAAVFGRALDQLRAGFDARWGGFGGAPKFPQQMAVELILRRGSGTDRQMAVRTLDAMFEGGMYDHVGGGFARYSVDEKWLVPHFEKMLYDNAQLVPAYLDAFRATGRERYRDVAQGTLDYLLEVMRDPAGGFHSSEDADSEGEEGRFYVFTPKEIKGWLGDVDGTLFCEAFGITEGGNFEHGASVAHLFSRSKGTVLSHGAIDEGLDHGEYLVGQGLEVHLKTLLKKVKAQRDRRIRPGKDDKILAAWNGLALTAFAKGYQVLDEPRLLEAACRCAEFLRKELWDGEQLLRVWRQGKAHTPAFLEDYAAVADGLVDLYEAGGDAKWLRWAESLADTMRRRFECTEEGGFFSTEAGQGDILFRQKPGFDNAVPSGNTLAARALLRLAQHLDRPELRESAERALRLFAPWMQRAPRAFLGMLSVLDRALSESVEVVVAGPPEDVHTRALLKAAWKAYLPNAAFSLAGSDPTLPLHQGRGAQDGRPAAYVCRDRACLAPVTDPEVLSETLVTGR